MSGEGKVAAGDPAPDALLEDGKGQGVRLSEIWEGTRIVLVFMRHLG
jgi:peroxiredoxin